METKASFRLLAAGEQPAFRSARVAAFHHLWHGLAQAACGLPTRAQIDPAAMRPLLPYVLIVDLESGAQGALRIRYRLVGTEVARFSGLDFTGAYLDELDFDLCTTDDLTAAYRQIHTARRPGLGMAFAQLADDQVMDVEYLICPLVFAAGGAITQCIALEDYMPSANYDAGQTKLGRSKLDGNESGPHSF
jgi:hypothetical protein